MDLFKHEEYINTSSLNQYHQDQTDFKWNNLWQPIFAQKPITNEVPITSKINVTILFWIRTGNWQDKEYQSVLIFNTVIQHTLLWKVMEQ